jgi:phosphoglycerate kinase
MLELLTDSKPDRPYTAIVGGDSFARKAQLLWALLLRVDHVLLGGVVANTCLVAQGWQPGTSRYEASQVDAARVFLEAARAQGVTVHLPVDAVTMQWEAGLRSTERRLIHEVPQNEAVVDVGLETSLAYAEVLRASSTVLWNGLMGMGEAEELCGGTYRIGQAATTSAQRTAVFGKRTVAVGERLDVIAPFGFVSFGGEGALSMMGGTVLPGVEALRVATAR